MLTRIGHAAFAADRRILVTSDIHGHCDQLRQLLEKACYEPDNDALIIVGDMLEKGWQNLETLRMVMRLSENGEVYTLIGNADLTLYNFLTVDDGEVRKKLIERINGGKRYWSWTVWDEVCQEIGMPYAPDMDFDEAVRRARVHLKKEIEFLGNALTILETPEYIFVHAALPHERLSELEGTDNWPLVKTDDFYGSAPAFSRWVVTGHWPVPLMRETLQSANPVVDEVRKLICLDGGCGVKRVEFMQRRIYTTPDKFKILRADHPAILHSVWQAPDGEKALLMANYTANEQAWEHQGRSGVLPPHSYLKVTL